MSDESTFWKLINKHLPAKCHVQRIETGSTGRGIPDVNQCHQGVECWVELKIVKGKQVKLSPEQIAWHFRRARAGGTSWVIARDKADGVRKGKYDRIYVWPSSCVQGIFEKGIKCEGAFIFEAPFDWVLFQTVLFGGGCEKNGLF